VAAGAALALTGMVAVAAVWRRALRLVGAELAGPEAVALYFQGELAKYVPGGPWAVVGRAELARRRGVAPAAAYAGVALSLAGLYLAAALVAGALLAWAPGRARVLAAAALLAVVLVGVGVLHPRALTRLLALSGRVLAGPVVVPRWGASLGLVPCYLPAWALMGTATWCLARALAAHASYPNIMGATALAWLAGFLAVPVPGGVGVREAVFVASVSLPGGVAAAVAIAARMAFMMSDALGGAVASAVMGLGRRPSSTAEG
jgi:uncharacterized membrane protein YbhN (UPF0104 family)